ncbi:MAG: germination protein YpeB [Clostridia bacterium]|nr:germination protein YpeB [Clostridia bacterium]
MKKNTEIATNLSSGAEKVETIEKKTTQSGANKTQTAKKTTVKKTSEPSANKPAQKTLTNAQVERKEELAKKESERAKKRVELALAKKKAQAEKAEKRKAEKEARRKKAEAAKAERKKKAAEKKAAKAEKRKEALEKRKELAKQRKEQAKKRKEERKARANNKKKTTKKNNGERKRHAPGYGGWLAAVISLGAVTLALTTVVTLGAVDMAGMRRGAATNYRGTIYEFVGVMENLDDDLDRVRISATPAQQSRILTDLLVQARIAETDLEKLPMDAETDRNLTSFINRTAAAAEGMLAKIRNGERLSARDAEILEGLYQTNHTVRTTLDKIAAEMTDDDLQDFIKGAKNKIGDAMENIENATLPENGKLLPSFNEWKTAGAGMSRTTTDEKKKDTKIASETAQEKVRGYFSDYQIKKVEFAGETLAKGMDAYNFILTDKDGVQIYAQVSEFDGRLVKFDYYKDCKKQILDAENAKDVAEDFLEKLGYDDMTVVKMDESGSTAEFTFVYEEDDFVYYPDMVKVKVCEERGVVSGFDASKYIRNSHKRIQPSAKLSESDAKSKLHESLSVEHSRGCVIEVKGGERTAYEFLCSYGDSRYLIYIDANTGSEISILNTQSLR